MRTEQLEETAVRCRKNVIRMLRASGHGHVGGALSCIDILTAIYFYKNFGDGQQESQDHFLLSAGHKCMAQYAVLAEKGYFPKEILDTYGELHSKIPGHPDMHKLPGIEANTGALGHGLSIAAGMAMGLRLDQKNGKVYVVMGDGELAEGSNWEAAAAAVHHKLENLVVFVDNNGLQISGNVEKVMDFTPIDEHFKAFGWAVENIDGNNMQEIMDVLDHLPLENGKPSLIVAHTTKCKGIPEGENRVEYHYWSPSVEELDRADESLDKELDRLQKGIN